MKTHDTAVVKIADISSNDFFKVSRKNYQSNLVHSLKISGMLEAPVLIKTDAGYSIFTSHNRIAILRESGTIDLEAVILSDPDAELFIKHASLKTYRNELGPFGKLKTLILLNTFFKIESRAVKEFCSKILKLPLDVIDNEEYVCKLLEFPVTLIDYLDEKDMSFKTIRDMSLLPQEWLVLIDKWLKNTPVRVNIFRMLVDYLFDMYRRGDSIAILESFSFSDDKTLYDSVFRIRYPEFSKLKVKSESIISDLSGGGLTIDFPEYFDRGTFTLKLEIDKRTDCNLQLKKIKEIDVEKLKDLLSLL